MKKIFLSLFFLVSLTTSGATSANAQDAQATLLDSAPEQKPYIVPMGLTKEERQWFIKFQEGNFFVDGWQDITTSILEKTPVPEKSQQKRLLVELGNKIGIEWCKDNDVRKVDNAMLKTWGKQLKNIAKKNPDNLETVLVAISNELDSLKQ